MASRFVWRLKSVPQVFKRGYASESHSAPKSTEQFPAESFGGNAWRNALIAVIAGVAWYRVDQHITQLGEEKHPFTKWIEYHMTSSSENDRVSTEKLDEAGKLAEYRLVTQEAQRPPIYRMRYPESFERASPRGLSAGAQADLSDLKVRSD